MGQRHGCERLFSPYQLSVRVAGRYNDTFQQARLYNARVHDRECDSEKCIWLYSDNVNYTITTVSMLL